MDSDEQILAAIEQQQGDDLIRGGEGNDLIVDGIGSNTLYGEAGNDVLIGYDTPSEISSENAPTPDTLNGGSGSDILLADSGDTVTGGQDADEFWVYNDVDTVTERVTVTDFDPNEDRLVVDVYGNDLSGLTDDEAVDLSETPDGLLVEFLGQEVALLQGVTMADLPADTTNLFSITV